VVDTFPKDHLHWTHRKLEINGPMFNQAVIFALYSMHHSQWPQLKLMQHTPHISYSHSVSLSEFHNRSTRITNLPVSHPYKVLCNYASRHKKLYKKENQKWKRLTPEDLEMLRNSVFDKVRN